MRSKSLQFIGHNIRCPHLLAGLAGGSVGSARLGKVSLESSEKDSAESLDKHSGASLESPDSAAHPAGEEAFDYSQIAEEHRIHARELTVVKFVGSGGYGEVYLGKWHSSEAAIKCLNPSLFFNGGHVFPSLSLPSPAGVGLRFVPQEISEKPALTVQNSVKGDMLSPKLNIPHPTPPPPHPNKFEWAVPPQFTFYTNVGRLDAVNTRRLPLTRRRKHPPSMNASQQILW
jgi:serine/threonine protein kinase